MNDNLFSRLWRAVLIAAILASITICERPGPSCARQSQAACFRASAVRPAPPADDAK